MATIEGTGIKAPSKESSKKATAFLGGFQKKADEKFIKTYERKQEAGIDNSDFETDRYNKLKKKYGDQFSSDASTRFGNQFSPSVEVASANLTSLNVGDSFTKQTESNLADSSTGEAQPLSLLGSDEYKQELKQYEESIRKDYPGIERYGIDELDNLTEEGQKRLEDSYNIYRDYNYERNPLKYQQGIDFSKKEEKKGLAERISDFAGNIFNTVTGTQPAAASQIPGGMPTGTQFSPSGDTSFASYRMAGGGQQQGSGIVTPFSQTSMGKGEPRNITKFQDTSMGRKTVTIDGQEVAKKQTVASLPSNYKQTEAREFAKVKAYQSANKNPNVTTSIGSKGQVTVSPANNTGVARAQASAYNRKISGKSISQTKADNKAAIKKSAAERQAAFKKTGKSTVGARKAAAKAAMKAKAKKRHSAFKAKRKAKKAKKSKKGKKGKK